MNEKNDLKPKNAANRPTKPQHCLQCDHEMLEEVQYVPDGSHSVKRVAEKGLFRYFWPTLHDLYGW